MPRRENSKKNIGMSATCLFLFKIDLNKNHEIMMPVHHAANEKQREKKIKSDGDLLKVKVMGREIINCNGAYV